MSSILAPSAHAHLREAETMAEANKIVYLSLKNKESRYAQEVLKLRDAHLAVAEVWRRILEEVEASQ